jgi:deazaflavin-dependent oxidoreductase (nitroreductase family)
MYDLVRSNEEKLRSGFRILNKFMVILWKLGLADWINVWPTVFGQIMVITHKGRKTGYKRLNPVNFAIIDGEIYCTAGFGDKSDWFRNILINPNVEVWLTEGRWEGIAEDVSSHPDRLFFLREVLIASGFAAPLAGLYPKKIDDETLDRLTSTYRLIRIKRIKERTGRDGPGELAWIWPLITVILLLWKSRRKRK